MFLFSFAAGTGSFSFLFVFTSAARLWAILNVVWALVDSLENAHVQKLVTLTAFTPETPHCEYQLHFVPILLKSNLSLLPVPSNDVWYKRKEWNRKVFKIINNV